MHTTTRSAAQDEDSAGPGDGGLGIAIVGWAGDAASQVYRSALATLVATMRHESGKAVTATCVDAKDATGLVNAFQSPCQVLIYSGHGVCDGDGFFLSAGPATGKLDLATVGPVPASTVVLDCCQGATQEARAALAKVVTRPTAVLACARKAPFTHGPVLMPMLLARLACPQGAVVRDAAHMCNLMAGIVELAPKVWPGEFSRWESFLVTPT